MTIKNFTGDKLSTQSLVLRNLECGDNISDLIINEHHLIKKHQIYCLEKLNSRGLYNMQLLLNVEKPTAQTYFLKVQFTFLIFARKQTFSRCSYNILSKIY